MDYLLESCTLCPRHCGVNRLSGELGVCRAPASLLLARAALHHWEEPCLSGSRGSGTIFFSGCPMHCVYCQNHAISNAQYGKEVSLFRLCEIFYELYKQGAHNINLVTPTHYVPQIKTAIETVKKEGFPLPFVYNTSGYERLETLQMLDGLIDIYLPDFKYDKPETACRCSAGPDYPEVARTAFAEMFRQVGPLQFDGELLTKGLVARHLVLPGHENEAKSIISYLYHTYGDDIIISIMNQYTPIPPLSNDPLLGRRLSDEEYGCVVRYAESLGIENA
ncbi:MAG: 4Fe-4S cluster-binding domain-containing protein, partial [Clostridia bacterium]|nr:4Fe-4S cluster-binding domain-containing protein [Clostridia bacterium]